MYLICLALGWFTVPASLAINGVLAIFFVLPPELLKKRSG